LHSEQNTDFHVETAVKIDGFLFVPAVHNSIDAQETVAFVHLDMKGRISGDSRYRPGRNPFPHYITPGQTASDPDKLAIICFT
jgi:hypothetical protein